MKKLIPTIKAIVLLLFFHLTVQAQQNTSIRGKIYTSEGKPAEGVTIQLLGRKQGISSNGKGEYKILNVAPGAFRIRVSAIGIVPIEKNGNASSDIETILDFTLDQSQDQLHEVNISAGKINKFASKKSNTVAKMPLKNLENPQSYVSISKELMKEQLVTNFNDAIKNAPGLDKLWSSTGRAGDGASYYSLRGFEIQPGLINGIAGLNNGDVDPAGIEKIEVIKGPSGTLYGGALTSFGGLINIQTKRPVDTLGGEISYSTGNFNLNRITADIYGPINKEKTLLARVNTAYHYQNSFQDAGFKKSFYIAPSFEYRASDKLTLNLDVEFYNTEGTNPTMVFLNRGRQLFARNPKELQFDFNRSYTSNDVTIKTPVVNVRGQATYKINKEWTSQTNFSRSYRKSEGFYQYLMYLAPDNDTLINRTATLQNSNQTAFNLQQNFTGDFKIGNLRNRIVVGLDFLNQQSSSSDSPYFLYDQVNTSINDPRYINYSKSQLMAKLQGLDPATNPTSRYRTQSNVYSVYASDVLNVTDQLLAMASVRIDRFQNKGTYDLGSQETSGAYSQTAVSPKFGLVYQVVKDQVSLFGNYMNGFQNVAPVIQPAGYPGNFKPLRANQIEGGVKLDIFKNKLNFTASYYDIKVDNVMRGITVDINGSPYNVSIQDGTQQSRGFEFDLIANPIQGLNIIAGYSHNNSKMVKADPGVLGRRPTGAGPADQVNLWLSYTLTSGTLEGLGAGFGGNYAGKNMITNSLETGIFTLPAYTVLNGTVFYGTKSYRIGLKVDNLTDQTYYKGWTTVERQMPRSVLANLSFKF